MFLVPCLLAFFFSLIFKALELPFYPPWVGRAEQACIRPQLATFRAEARTHFTRVEKTDNEELKYPMKDKFETFRASERERQELKRMAKKSKMSKSDYIRHCVFNKEIVVIDGLDDFAKQLKAIGNNLNQLTTRANMGHFETINLAETKEQLGKIYEKLTALCRQESVEQVAKFVNDEEINSIVKTENVVFKQEVKQDLSYELEVENERKGLLSFLNRRS